jgi:hypothetical protein
MEDRDGSREGAETQRKGSIPQSKTGSGIGRFLGKNFANFAALREPVLVALGLGIVAFNPQAIGDIAA